MNQSYDSMDPRQRQARRAAMRKKKEQQRQRRMLLTTVAGIALLVILLIVLLAQCGNRSDTPASTADTAGSTGNTTEVFQDISWATFPADRELTAQQYFVFDCSAGKFTTISHDPATRIYPASITKLITASVALQYLQPDQMITAGNELNMVAAGSSVAELKKGDTLSVKDLIGGMILPSGNDAAHVLAAQAGRILLNKADASAESAVDTFVTRMNEYAREIGMRQTHFANPDGIHSENHYTTFEDLVSMALNAMNTPSLLEYCATSHAVIKTEDRNLQWFNTNHLVDPLSEYYCPYAIGLKTGQTPVAGSCLLSAFDINGSKYIIGVFGCPDIESRFADTLQLLNQSLHLTY